MGAPQGWHLLFGSHRGDFSHAPKPCPCLQIAKVPMLAGIRGSLSNLKLGGSTELATSFLLGVRLVLEDSERGPLSCPSTPRGQLPPCSRADQSGGLCCVPDTSMERTAGLGLGEHAFHRGDGKNSGGLSVTAPWSWGLCGRHPPTKGHTLISEGPVRGRRCTEEGAEGQGRLPGFGPQGVLRRYSWTGDCLQVLWVTPVASRMDSPCPPSRAPLPNNLEKFYKLSERNIQSKGCPRSPSPLQEGGRSFLREARDLIHLHLPTAPASHHCSPGVLELRHCGPSVETERLRGIPLRTPRSSPPTSISQRAGLTASISSLLCSTTCCLPIRPQGKAEP